MCMHFPDPATDALLPVPLRHLLSHFIHGNSQRPRWAPRLAVSGAKATGLISEAADSSLIVPTTFFQFSPSIIKSLYTYHTKKFWKGYKKAKNQNREPTQTQLPEATTNWQPSLVTEHVGRAVTQRSQPALPSAGSQTWGQKPRLSFLIWKWRWSQCHQHRAVVRMK